GSRGRRGWSRWPRPPRRRRRAGRRGRRPPGPRGRCAGRPPPRAARGWAGGRSCREGFEEGEGGARARVELGQDPVREGVVHLAVAEGKAGGAREAGGAGELLEDGVGAVVGGGGGGLLAVGEVAEDDAGDLGEDAGEVEVRPHAVEAVGALADVLEEEERAAEVGEVRRPEEAREDGEIPTHEPPARAAGDERARALHRRRGLVGFEEGVEALEGVGRLLRQLREDGAVDGGAVASEEREVERGDVGEADEGLERGVVEAEAAEEPHRAVAATRAEDGAGAVVAEGLVELVEAAVVVAGEVAGFRVEARVEDGLVAAGEDVESSLEGFTVERARGRDDADPIRRPQTWRLLDHGPLIARGPGSGSLRSGGFPGGGVEVGEGDLALAGEAAADGRGAAAVEAPLAAGAIREDDLVALVGDGVSVLAHEADVDVALRIFRRRVVGDGVDRLGVVRLDVRDVGRVAAVGDERAGAEGLVETAGDLPAELERGGLAETRTGRATDDRVEVEDDRGGGRGEGVLDGRAGEDRREWAPALEGRAIAEAGDEVVAGNGRKPPAAWFDCFH